MKNLFSIHETMEDDEETVDLETAREVLLETVRKECVQKEKTNAK